MKILIDMNLSPKLEEILIENGFDAIHWSKIGAPNVKDIEIMEYADNNNCIIITCDLDFNVLLSTTNKIKPSIIQLRVQRINISQDGEWITSIISKNEDALKKGAIISVDIKKHRVRLLPL